MNLSLYLILILATLTANTTNQDSLNKPILIQEVEIYGGLDENSNAVNIEVIKTERNEMNGNYNFENIIPLTANLHFSGGTSRPKYFQLRGLGELSQFSGEGAPHFYVGFIVDNIDFSGIGMIGNLFDTKQIEIFKGPQSSTYGPNAMAGVINIVSNEPINKKTLEFNLSTYSFNGKTINITTSLPLNDKVLTKFTLSKNYTNGYIQNISNIDLPKFNTNSKNESMFRSKILIKPNSHSNITITSYYINLDNKYDAWAPDNNGFTTYSDYQGFDKQESKAVSMKINLLNKNNNFTYISSYSDNTMNYSYDGDWANDNFWSSDPYDWNSNNSSYWGPWSFTDNTDRRRFSYSQEFRIKRQLKNNIIITSGIFSSHLKELDTRNGWLFAGYATSINSDFTILNHAMYSKVSIPITKKLMLTASIRLDNNTIKQYLVYDNGNYENKIKDKNLLGTSIKGFYTLNNFTILNLNYSTGYKTAGINQTQSPFLTENLRIYKTEHAKNIDLGITHKNKLSETQINLFYMVRKNPQLRLSYQVDPQDPTSFDYATFNANKAYHYGLEISINRQLTKNIRLKQSFSNLNTYVSKFEYRGSVYGNRELAHAPNFKYNIELINKIFDNLIMEITSSHVGSFYFEEQNDEKSESYNLLNVAVKYIYKNFEIGFWSRNIANKKYAVRGYTFVLDPSYIVKNYQTFGEPKTIGITLSYKL